MPDPVDTKAPLQMLLHNFFYKYYHFSTKLWYPYLLLGTSEILKIIMPAEILAKYVLVHNQNLKNSHFACTTSQTYHHFYNTKHQ